VDANAIIAGVIVIVVAATFVGAGGWFFRERLGWFRPTHRGPKSPTQPQVIVRDPKTSGTTVVNVYGGTVSVYVDGLPQAAPEVRDHFQEGQRLQEAHAHDKAIAEFQAALATADTDSRRGAVHLHIGISHYLSGRLTQAEGSYTEALRLFRAAADEQGEAAALANLGLVYADRGDLDRAEGHQKQALEIDRRIDNPLGEANELGNLGNVYLLRGDLERAEEHYKQALEIDQRSATLQARPGSSAAWATCTACAATSTGKRSTTGRPWRFTAASITPAARRPPSATWAPSLTSGARLTRRGAC